VSAYLVLLTFGGLLVSSGVVMAVAAATGVRLGTGWVRRRRRTAPVAARLRLGALAAGAVTLLVTGWPVAAAAVGAAVIFLPSVLGGARVAQRNIARVEALEEWTRLLAGLVESRAAGSVVEALQLSASMAPAPIERQVTDLALRLGRQDTVSALHQWAGEVDDPSGDVVAMVLIRRQSIGSSGLHGVLTGLAADLAARTTMVREVEAERAKPRANARTIVTATLGMIALMVLFARSYLSPYGSPAGELALLLVVGVFAVALRWMRRLANPPENVRVLVDPRTARPTRTVAVLR